MSYAAVIFDLDGTLVDSAGDIAEAVNRTLQAYALPPVPEATVRGWIGDGVRALLRTALDAAGSARLPEEVMPEFMRHYRDCLLRSPRLYPGVIETLTRLQARGTPMAICTNKPSALLPPLLEHLRIAGFFAHVVGGDSLPQRKPDAAPLLYLAQALQLAPGQCLMVGDSATDLGAADNAGMPIALVRYGYRRELDLEAAGAVAVVDDLRQLL
ncbi:phosphoglycolate phosphatase [Stenotrophomonas sp. YIM B06876]|uniref:phosphoglycolate phosphatase n=1 Tax=Stenotrophomonas sp. YIM B06876 TaxID=3060211 RepID=UPI002738D927|nr:phosphoglycolate phosphatase [Stenotrophomonas sp. YIM B06876]